MCHMDNTCAAAPFQSSFVLFLTYIPFFFPVLARLQIPDFWEILASQILEKLILVANSTLESLKGTLIK